MNLVSKVGICGALFDGFCHVAGVAAAPLADLAHGHVPRLVMHPVDGPADADDASLLLYLSVAAILVLLGGAFAGLTIA